jgi:hypothetical protein
MLDVTPDSSITSASMWESPSDAEGAMYGAFSQFRTAFGVDYLAWGDYRTGFYTDGYSLGSYSYDDLWNNLLDGDSYGTNWENLYRLINDCNLILKHTPDIEFSNKNDINFILGESYFMRAFAYYYIARIWGDAPILTSGFESDKTEDLYPSREEQSKVFDQVESDLNKAIGLIPKDYSIPQGTASIYAAYMLQADVYLWLAKVEGNTDAIDLAQDAVDYVLNDGDKLSSTYEDIFRNDNNAEIIFQIIYAENEAENPYADDFLIPIANIEDESLINNPIPLGTTQWVIYKDSFKDFLWENESDTRAKVNVDVYEGYNNWINKFLGIWSNETRIFDTDTRVYRYAEAILFKAEIENELGNTDLALTQLNKIAKRAYGIENYYEGSYSKEELDELILNERLKEFASEGKAWFDLIRFGKAFEKIETLQGRENETNILLWPVNDESINSNENIKQTVGYD